MYFLPKSLSSIHPTQTTSLPVANVVTDQIYTFPVIIPQYDRKRQNEIEREKGLKLTLKAQINDKNLEKCQKNRRIYGRINKQ